MTTLTDVARIKYLFSKKWSDLSDAEKQEFLAGAKGSLNISDLNEIGELISDAFSEYELGTPTASFPFAASNPPTADDLDSLIADIVSIQVKSSKNAVQIKSTSGLSKDVYPTTSFQNLAFDNFDDTITYLEKIPKYISKITIKVNNELHNIDAYNSGTYSAIRTAIIGSGFAMNTIQEFKIDEYRLNSLDFNASGLGMSASVLEKVDISNVQFAGAFGLNTFQNYTKLTDFKFSQFYGRENQPENGRNFMFNGCTNLENLQMPIGGLKSIGISMFRNCSKLTTITIPDSVTAINGSAFRDCISLSTFNFAGTKEQWNSISFGDNWNLGLAASVVHCSDGDLSI